MDKSKVPRFLAHPVVMFSCCVRNLWVA